MLHSQKPLNKVTPEKTRRSDRLSSSIKLTEAAKLSLAPNQKEPKKAVQSILRNKNGEDNKEAKNSILHQTIFLADLHITKYATYCEVSFEVQESSKPTQAVQIPLIQIVDKAQ